MKKIYYAVYYERVSTVHDEQTNSLESQRELKESYLKRHPEIQLVESYSERISGKSDLRPQFNAMIKRVEQGGIDYILVKDLKRLSRSSEVSAQLRTFVKKNHCQFILLATGEIYDPNADDKRMVYGFESLVNEEMVFRQSEYGRIAHRQKMEAKKLNRQNCTFCHMWDYEKNDMVINEDHAAIMREIFDMVAFQYKGIREIKEYLIGLGIYRTEVTIGKWLKETAWIGVFHMNKKGSELGVGAGQKTKRFTNPEEEWVSVERPDLAIVDKEIFDLVQSIRKSRYELSGIDKNGNIQGRFRGSHLFAAKLFCKECGCSYVHKWADRAGTVGIYRDSFRCKKHVTLKPCGNTQFSSIYESDMEKIVLTAINGLIEKGQDCFELLYQVLQKNLEDDRNVEQQQKSLKKELCLLRDKQAKTRNAYLETPSGTLRTALMDDYERLEKRAADVESQIRVLEEERGNIDDISAKMDEIKEAIRKLMKLEELDRETVEFFIRKILIDNKGNAEVIFNSGGIQRYHLEKRRRHRSGAAFTLPERFQYIYGEAWYEGVVKMLIQGTPVLYPQDMPTARRI